MADISELNSKTMNLERIRALGLKRPGGIKNSLPMLI